MIKNNHNLNRKLKYSIMELFYNETEIEAACDEVGRGCLFGPVYSAAVIWPKTLNPDIEHPVMKDSKAYSKKKLLEMEKYVKENCLEYSIGIIDNIEIDKINILNATFKSMHQALDKLNTKFDSILVDGNRFEAFYDKKTDDWLSHTCIIKGDMKYYGIAAASILAKTARDRYIQELCEKYKFLNTNYKLNTNVGYASKYHRDGIHKHGITNLHRKTFGICRDYNENIAFLE